MKLFIALILTVAVAAIAQQPSTDSLIKHTLDIVDIPPFEWNGTPDAMKPRLGMYMNYVPSDSVSLMTHGVDTMRGNRIWHISPHWSADEAGLLEGDIILRVNGLSLRDSVYGPDDILNTRVSEMKAGEVLQVQFIRDGVTKTIPVPLTSATRTPMPYTNPPRLGDIHKDTWLQQTLAKTNLTEAARIIEKQMRIVADQDYCMVPFAKRPSPWRLNAVTYLHNHPLRVGAYSRMIDQDVWDGLDRGPGLCGALTAAAKYLDLKGYINQLPKLPETPGAMISFLAGVQTELDSAYAPVRSNLDSLAYHVSSLLDMNASWEDAIDSAKNPVAKREARMSAEQKLAAVLGDADKVDLFRVADGASRLAALADSTWLSAFAKKCLDSAAGKTYSGKIDGVEGTVILAWDTPNGKYVIGGTGPNRYTGNFRMIIDLGGDDVYDLSPCPVGTCRFVADISGNDVYQGAASAGSGVGCVDVLVDCAGNDSYRGSKWSQGSGCLGIGILADFGGDDVYSANWCSQGAAFLGIGMLADGAGSDNYVADVYSQGFAYAKGFGALLERAGNDSYRAGWKYEDSRYPNRAHVSMSQGFGFGMRPWSTGVGTDGGIGLLSDRQGDDVYNADYFSQGGSYWYALGILHDWQGADRYSAGQYSQGSGIHLSFGALLDDAGDDSYDAYAGLEQGNAHDWSGGCLEDFSGNDTYRGSGSSQGSALTVSFAYLLDSHGDDFYYARLSDTTLSQGGGNKTPVRKSGSLGLLLDMGHGDDHYIEQRVQPGVAVVKGNRGIIYDDGTP